MTGSCKAICQIASSSNNNVLGYLTITQAANDGVTITGTLSGLTPGKHGLAVCAAGDLSEGAKSCGVVFNPFGEFVCCGCDGCVCVRGLEARRMDRSEWQGEGFV